MYTDLAKKGQEPKRDLGLDFLNILDFAVLNRVSPLNYQIYGKVPDFYRKLFPAQNAIGVSESPWVQSSMLEYFLLDAEDFFGKKNLPGAKVKSGIWLEEDDETNEEFPLVAKAWQLPNNQIITIQVIQEEYEERVRILRKARVELLERRKISGALSSFKKKALFDGMTQLYNKTTFLEILNEQIEKLITYTPTLAIFIIDVDNFKKVNDTLGHLVGDSVLVQVAETLKNSLRKNDSPCRYGGDEFTVIAPDTNIEQSHKLAEKLRHRIEHHDFGTGEIPVTISVGYTIYRAGENSANFIRRADQALYEAKQRGRNQCCFRDPWFIDDDELNSAHNQENYKASILPIMGDKKVNSST